MWWCCISYILLDSIVQFLLLLFCSKRPKLECLPWKACNSPPQSCVCRRSSSHRGRLRRSFNITFFIMNCTICRADSSFISLERADQGRWVLVLDVRLFFGSDAVANLLHNGIEAYLCPDVQHEQKTHHQGHGHLGTKKAHRHSVCHVHFPLARQYFAVVGHTFPRGDEEAKGKQKISL